jgi:hypothetical protein
MDRIGLTLLCLISLATQAAAATYDYAYSYKWLDTDTMQGRFGSIWVGDSASRTLRIWNNGRNVLTIMGVEYPKGFKGPARLGRLKAGRTFDLTITFRPKKSGTYRAPLRVLFKEIGPFEFIVRGRSNELIEANGKTAFGDVPVGLSEDSTLTLRSTLGGTWKVNNVVPPEGFTASRQREGNRTRLRLVFTPQAARSYSGRVAVNYEHAGYGKRVLFIDVSGRGSTKSVSQRIRLQPWGNKKFGDPPFRIAWESRSGIKPRFRSSNPEVADVRKGRVMIRGAGRTTITAEAEGSGPWKKSASTRDLIVRKASQTVIFNTSTTARKFRGPGSSFALSASATSNLPVEFSSSDTTVLSVDQSRAVMWGRGRANITARQKGDKNYRAAKLTRIFRIE